jgi:hypothetical protein
MMLAMINQKLRSKQDRLYLAFVEARTQARAQPRPRPSRAVGHTDQHAYVRRLTGVLQMDKDRSGWLSVSEITEVLQKQVRAGPRAALRLRHACVRAC